MGNDSQQNETSGQAGKKYGNHKKRLLNVLKKPFKFIKKIINIFKCPNPITKVSKSLFDFCGKKERTAFWIVVAFFVIAFVFILCKDFFAKTTVDISPLLEKLSIENLEKEIVLNTGIFSSLGALLVDFATLPLLLITIMFSMHGGYGNSKLIISVNEIKADLENVKKNIISKNAPNGENVKRPFHSTKPNQNNDIFQDVQNDAISSDKAEIQDV